MRLFLLALLFSPGLAFAHGDAPSLEAQEGQYLIDIGYGELAANMDVEFDIDLFMVGPPIDYADFAEVDVRVTRNGAEIVAGAVPNDGINIPVFIVNFPEPGGYDIDVRFLDSSDALLAAHTFHLEIPTPSGLFMRRGIDWLHYAIAGGLFALSAGILAYAVWDRFRPKR